jgi:hypothetical protein
MMGTKIHKQYLHMFRISPIRMAASLIAVACFAGMIAIPVRAQGAAPPNQARRWQRQRANRGNVARYRGEHLEEWMEHHSNLTPEQQQKALEAEPGFNQLPPVVQQRQLNMLARLNAMAPQKRQRLLERNEWIEHLTPPQREQVRAVMKQLSELPPDQRRYVDRTFYGLRELPPSQRRAVLNSERFGNLTEAQRASLNSLLEIEPLIPPPYEGPAPGRPEPQRVPPR